MSVQLYVSNSLKPLAGRIASDLKQDYDNVFRQQFVVTQTEGMNHWLRLQIAEHLGIAANCRFIKPNDIVSQIYFWLGGKSKTVFNTDYAKWNLFHFLSDPEFMQQFPAIATYYQENDLKQIALATKIADLFDQYQIYRPEIIQEWNKASLSSVQDDWQQYLWIRLRQASNEDLLDKTGMIESIIELLKEKEKQILLQSKLPALYFFGIAVITPFYLKLFYALSRIISIRFYLLNPAPTSYWLEDQSEKEIARFLQRQKKKVPHDESPIVGNTLLQSWGTIIKESFALLFRDETYINQYNDELAIEPPPPQTLLKKIQHDIFYNAPEEERNLILSSDIKDGSMTINACFTQVREVEVLYNYLVHLINQKKETLSARDIVVMVSDIDTYAPYIRAVFEHAPYTFPFSIVDERIASGNNLFNAIELLLSIEENEITAEQVLELLESKYIRERFQIKDVELIRKAVLHAGIRFGLKGDRENETRQLSWEYGLQRILYGICISGSPEFETETDRLFPIDLAEGNASTELIRFCHFMEMLQYTVRKRAEEKQLTGWIAYLQELVENMVFQAGEQEDEAYHHFISYLERLSLLEPIHDSNISFEVFRHSFLNLLQTETKAQTFAGSGITFCSLIPMRSIPFKVVAMLGMNFDQFPRKEQPISFNLIARKKQKGDRNVKDNDKHLFLETLLSAEQYFYISYIGKSSKDASTIPPSSLVDELIDYIIRGTEDGTEQVRLKLVTTHPLHGFSQLYFNGSGLVSYLSDDHFKAGEPKSESKTETPDYSFEEIAISDLLRFFQDPFKWFLNKSLGIYYEEDEQLLPDTELFELNKLEQWQIDQDLISLNESEIESYYRTLKQTGKLPLRNIGRFYFNQEIEKIQPFKIRIDELINGLTAETREIHLQLSNHLVTGTIHSVYGNNCILYNTSSNYNKFLVKGYLTFLFAAAQGLDLDFYFVLMKDPQTYYLSTKMISKEAAIQKLEALLESYKNGFYEPFLFFPSIKNPLKLFETNDPNRFMENISKLKSTPNDYTFDDSYVNKALELGYFSDKHYEALRKNMLQLFTDLNNFFPGIIQ
jgi:exodeoxyribonuclease V gamma subunit